MGKANRNRQSDADNKREKSSKDATRLLAAKRAKRAEELPPERANAVEKGSEIPKFDLAEQIMAEQRKVAAVRRKGPSRKAVAPSQKHRVESIGYAVKPPPILSEQEQIIAEIVAMDIERLRRGNAASSGQRDSGHTEIYTE